VLLLLRVHQGASYVGSVLPPVLLIGLGMCLVVAPVTSTALDAIDEGHSGIASGVNNAVARIAGLVAVAVLPAAVGLTTANNSAGAFTHGFHRAMLVAAGCFAAGGLIAGIGLRRSDGRADSVTA
jgi:hypothetical protein